MDLSNLSSNVGMSDSMKAALLCGGTTKACQTEELGMEEFGVPYMALMPAKNKKKVLDYVLSTAPQVNYFRFKTWIVPNKLVSDDPLFVLLNAKYEYTIGVIKLDPFTCYDWHVDKERGVGVNMLLNHDGLSHCLFKSVGNEHVMCGITELVYEPDMYYALNTQVSHTVYNFAAPRYMMSVDFSQKKNVLSYQQFIGDINENNN